MLQRRPPLGRFRDQLFWLVDLIFTCKSSGNRALAAEAQLVEDALGELGQFLETGNPDSLNNAMRRVEQFARQVRMTVEDLDKEKEP